MSTGVIQRCARCGKPLGQGEVKYIMKITMTADFDGYISERDTGTVDTRELLQAIESKSKEDLENEVWLERVFLLCTGCRDAVMEDPVSSKGLNHTRGWVT